MADIELVIKIDEDTYKARQHWVANQKRMVDKVDIAIAKGTPLPKGHGALIDVDKIIGKIHGVRSITAVLDAPTIIEADEVSE